MHGGGDTPYAISRPMRIGPFLLRGVLGRGGTAEVHAAVDERDGSDVALKVADRAGAVRATFFRREASLASRLRHPHVVRLVTAGTLEDERPFLAFERVDGSTLEAIADRLDREGIVAVGEQLLEALTYAHDAGVVHCDLKPQNVLVASWEPGATPRVKLADFGLGGTREPSATDSAPLAGTPGYMSPEQARGMLRLSARSDLYSLGATLHRLASGAPPHRGATLFEILDRTANEDVPPLDPREVVIEQALIDVVSWLLARRPEERPASAARALSAWRAAAARHGRVSALPPRGSYVPPPPPPDLSGELGSSPRGATITATLESGSLRSSSIARGALARTLADHAPTSEPIVGREAELALCRAAFDEGPRVVEIASTPGAGSTRLLAELEASEGVIAARVVTRLGSVPAPLEGLATLAHELARKLGSEGDGRAERLGTALAAAGVEAGDPGRDALVAALASLALPVASSALAMAAFAAFAALVAHASREGARVVLIVDGAERLDAATRDVLASLVEGDEERRVTLVLGVAEGTARFGATTSRTALTLAPLHELDASALLGRAAKLRGIAAGNAARIAIAREAAARHGEALERARSWEELARTVAEGLSLERKVALALAHIAGGDVPTAALAALVPLRSPAADGARVVASLLEAKLLAPVDRPACALERVARVTSPDISESATMSLDEETRSGLAAALARWLADESPDRSAGAWEAVARHAEAGGARRLAAYALAEAALASASEAGGEATEALVSRALGVASRDGQAREALDVPALLATQADALLDAGHAERARRVAARALLAAEPVRAVLRARLSNAVARAALELGDVEGALAAIEEGLAILGEDGDPQELATLLAHKGWILGYVVGRNDEGIVLGRRALEVASRIDAPGFRASLCGRLGANLLRAGDWDGQLAINQEDLELSTRARDPRGVIRAHINLGVCFTNRGRLREAREHTEEALALSARYGWRSPGQIAHNNLAMIALDDGREAAADAHAREVLAIHERLGLARGVGETLCTLARLAIRRGDVVGAKETLARAKNLTEGTADAEVVLRIEALASIASGRPEEAAARLADVEDESSAADPYERAATWLTLAAARRGAGDDAGAEALEARADAVLVRLGADPRLERARWGAL